MIEHFDMDSINRDEIGKDKSTPKLVTFLKVKYNNFLKILREKNEMY